MLFRCLLWGLLPRIPASLVAQTVKNPLATPQTWVWSLDWKDPLEKEIATHSRIVAWEIPWTEEPGGLQSMRSQRVSQDWAINTYTFFFLNRGSHGEFTLSAYRPHLCLPSLTSECSVIMAGRTWIEKPKMGSSEKPGCPSTLEICDCGGDKDKAHASQGPSMW